MAIRVHVLATAFLCLLALSDLQAQRFRPKLRETNRIAYRSSKVYVGIGTGLDAAFMNYSDLHSQRHRIRLAGNATLSLEWLAFDFLSIGADLSFDRRNARIEFNTPYLTSFSSVAVTNIAYTLSADGLEFRMPLSWYLGGHPNRSGPAFRCFAFAGPACFIPLGGSLKWTRTHLDDNQVIGSFQMPLSTASFSTFDYGVWGGLGVACRINTPHYFCLVKGALSAYYGIPDTFSQAERNLKAHFYGLGDIQHETLGARHCWQAKFSLHILLPLRKTNHGACHINNGGI